MWTYYENATRDEGIDEGATTIGYLPEKGWFWHIPQHNNRISVGVVAEGKYLSRDGVKDPETIFKREIPTNNWIEEHLAAGKSTGQFRRGIIYQALPHIPCHGIGVALDHVVSCVIR